MLCDLTIMKTIFLKFLSWFFYIKEANKSYILLSERMFGTVDILSDSNNQCSDSIFVMQDILSGAWKEIILSLDHDNIDIIFFLCNVVWSLKDNIAKSFDPYSVTLGVLRQHYTGFFPVQSCLEALRQHCIGLWPVQCCPKSIKTTLNKIFSCALFSWDSRTTLHRVFISAILSQEYHLLGQHCTGKILCSIVLEAPDNLT